MLAVIQMIYNYDDMSFQILTIDKFYHLKGFYKTSSRPFASISIRLEGNGSFKTENGCFESIPGDITFFPENASYSAEYTGGECIAVHLLDCKYNVIENIRPKNAEKFKLSFSELLKIKDSIDKTNQKKALVYRILQMLSDEKKSESYENTIKKAVDFINIHYTNPSLNISEICQVANISEATLRRKFNTYFEMPPKQYISKLRINKAMAMLIGGNKLIKEVAIECGFSDEKYFSRCVKKLYGVAPSELMSTQYNNMPNGAEL